MSREAMEAVQDHTAITDPMGRNVLMAIARFIPANGGEGWASYRVLADVAGCDKDTVSRWVGIIESEHKEIKTRKEGNGRGTKIYYRLQLPIDQPKHGAVIWDNNQNIVPTKEGTISDGDIISVLSQQIELLSQQIELLSQRLELLSPLLSQNVPTMMGTETIETIEETNGKPETPTEARARAGEPTDDEYMQLATALVGQWQGVIGHYGRLLPENPQHRADYFAPALRLIVDFDGDIDAAWIAIEAEYGRMVQDGLTNVRKLAPVVSGVLGQMHRAKLPARASPNGTGSRQTRDEIIAEALSDLGDW